MPTLSSDTLQRASRAVLQALGTHEEAAQLVTNSLVEANLAGHDSHGVIRLLSYADQVRSGQVKPSARPSSHARRYANAYVDGAWGWGQPAAWLAVETAVDLATQQGIGAVAIGRCNHVGRLGEYVDGVARRGLVGLGFCNADPTVAPFGGRNRVLGTNPMAWSVPRRSGAEPLVHDFATAGVAEGKLRVARVLGKTVDEGLILDRAGRPSQDPADFYAGGALRPFGGHKGYGLSVMIEATAGLLSGMSASSLPEYGGGNGTLLVALDVSAFIPFDQFINQVERLCQVIKDSPKADGFDNLWLPGELEIDTRRRRMHDGVDVPEQTWEAIKQLAARLKVTL